MTITLIFNPEPGNDDKLHAYMAFHGSDFCNVLSDLDTEMRNSLKNDEAKDTEHWLQRLNELLTDYNVTLDI